MLAQARDTIPSPGALRGGLAMDLKWDGYRAIAFSPARPDGPFLLQTRRGSLIQDRFPDLAAAAVQLPPGLVLDGELLVLNSAGTMDFEVLQRRAVTTTPRAVQTLARAHPAYFVAFDILQLGGQPIVAEPYEQRRSRLEALFAGHALSPPWTLCPSTKDPAVAREWLETWTRTPGVEGVVCKGLLQPYRPGAIGWLKVRARQTTEAVVGAITGTLSRPRMLVLGRFDGEGRLRYVGKTTQISTTAAQQLVGWLTAASVGTHPWEDARFSTAWGNRDVLDTTLVAPDRVAEVSVDTAQDRGVWRHPVRLARLRLDMPVNDVPTV
ncbi:ATP-dependent DNA ligase [Streptomyces sp. NBC_00654]|uniref:ATP-dependent DNA ligase n=1 Tax=Streptomyces sp. NBC_00654 TaxID=2975799 RepID=UPI0022559089|nr:ATP-dependent DNA ligase [Streptomyces sp. NBC_00654]MCX4966281.1 ATP-dependent DNA ligase [Streptomyces sp. NBC_00654]